MKELQKLSPMLELMYVELAMEQELSQEQANHLVEHVEVQVCKLSDKVQLLCRQCVEHVMDKVELSGAHV